MKISRVLIPVFALLLLAGCYPPGGVLGSPIVLSGSGNVITRQYDNQNFDAVEVGSAFKVTITQAQNTSVSITADDNMFDYIEVTQSGQRLHIGLNTRRPLSLRSATLQANITVPSLSAVNFSGAVQGTVTGFQVDGDFAGTASGASRLTGALQATSTRLDASGASSIELTGQTNNLQATVSGASHLNLGDFPAQSGNVELSGASSATVDVTQTLDYSLSGASHLNYTGNPRIGRSQTSGGSSASGS